MTDAPDGIDLTVTLPAGQRMAINAALTRRAASPLRRWLYSIAAFLLPLAAGLVAAWQAGVPMEPALIILGATLCGAGVALFLLGQIDRPRVRRLIDGSPLQSAPAGLHLGPEGVRVEARSFPWAQVRGVSRSGAATLLDFSALDALVVPDNALPAGLTPETLASQIADWKAQ